MKIVGLAEVSNAQAAEWLVDLAEVLRPSDLTEIEATSGEDPAVSLVSSVMLSDHAWVILADDEEPIGVFGCAPSGDPEEGIVWMMGSPRMDEPAHALAILRLSRPYLDKMHDAYPLLSNHIDARNERSMKWLQWCGFEVIEAAPGHGRNGELFFLFARHRPRV